MTAEMAQTPEKGQADTLPRCSATCLDGQPCRSPAQPGKTCCMFHDPEAAPMLEEARRKGGLTRAAMLGPVDLGIGELDWTTAAGLARIMAGAGEKMLAGQLDPSRARALSEMAGRMLAALGGQVLDERLCAIESALEELEGAGGDQG